MEWAQAMKSWSASSCVSNSRRKSCSKMPSISNMSIPSGIIHVSSTWCTSTWLTDNLEIRARLDAGSSPPFCQKLFRDTGVFNTQAWRMHQWMGFGCHQNRKSCHHPTLGHQDRNAFTRNILKIQHVWFRFLGNTWFQSATQCFFNHPFFFVGARCLSAGRTWDSRVDQQGFEPCFFNHPTVNTKFLIHFKLRYPIFCKYVSLHRSSEHSFQCQPHTCHWNLSWSRTMLSSTRGSVPTDAKIGHHTHVHTLPQKVRATRQKAVQQPTCMHKAPGKQRMRHRKWHTKLQLQVVNQCHCLSPDRFTAFSTHALLPGSRIRSRNFKKIINSQHMKCTSLLNGTGIANTHPEWLSYTFNTVCLSSGATKPPKTDKSLPVNEESKLNTECSRRIKCSVKLWHAKLDRENRFQTSRAQSKPKPKHKQTVIVSRFCCIDSPRPSHGDTLTPFSSSRSWANVYVGS